MVMNVPGLSNRGPSPGSPAPISFGMSRDPSQSMSLNPGAGSMGTDIFGAALSGSGGGGLLSGGGGGQAAGGPIPQGWRPDTSLTIKDLAPVSVSALSPSSIGAPMFGSLYSDSGSSGSISAPDIGGVHVTNLAPTQVQAQMPVKPSWLDQLYMAQNDHPALSSLVKGVAGNIPLLGPVMVAANAYENYKHGQPLFGSLGGLGGSLAHLLSGLGDGPGGPLSTSPNSPLYASQYAAMFNGTPGAGSSDPAGSMGSMGGPALASSGALPAYPGLGALSGGSAPLGGFWNQRALHDAAPVYGPYAAFGHGTTSYLPAGAPFAPAGILGA